MLGSCLIAVLRHFLLPPDKIREEKKSALGPDVEQAINVTRIQNGPTGSCSSCFHPLQRPSIPLRDRGPPGWMASEDQRGAPSR
jgi:hypothetical protein